MWKHILLLVFSVPFIACKKEGREVTSSLPSVASDVVATGKGGDCNASEGYLWSEVRHTCIKPWESGAQFKPAPRSGGSTGVAFVVLAADTSAAEIFFSGRPPVILARDEPANDTSLVVLFADSARAFEIAREGDRFIIAEHGETTFVQPYSPKEGLGVIFKR